MNIKFPTVPMRWYDSFIASSAFLRTQEWLNVRQIFWALAKEPGGDYRCWDCDAKLTLEKVSVDHIANRAMYPLRALDINNLQCLCARCNRQKGNDALGPHSDKRPEWFLKILSRYNNSLVEAAEKANTETTSEADIVARLTKDELSPEQREMIEILKVHVPWLFRISDKDFDSIKERLSKRMIFDESDLRKNIIIHWLGAPSEGMKSTSQQFARDDVDSEWKVMFRKDGLLNSVSLSVLESIANNKELR